MSIRIILVDDRVDASAGLAQRLRRSRGVELLGVVRDAREACDLAEGTPDLVLLDLHEAHGHDQELCRTLSQGLSAPLVVLASFMTQERWRMLQRAGASRYVLRHVDSRGLVKDLTAVVSELTWEHMTRPQSNTPWDSEGNREGTRRRYGETGESNPTQAV